MDVRLTPRSSRDQIEGERTLSDGRKIIAARVRAVPEDGRANEALLRLVAKALNAPVSACALTAGAKSRIKTITVTGDPLMLDTALEALCD